ncbi:hypothetical protein Tco_0821284 [Tanacetum coccineum]|uniref:Uncharacterized protein n=1 Tax=Tanacetum coccineum TaxID=301880 RepID=A0ABQ5ABT7_9ASTR
MFTNAVRCSSTNAPPSSNSSSNFEFQQMAAALEDKMTLTFRNEMNEMKTWNDSSLCTPHSDDSRLRKGVPLVELSKNDSSTCSKANGKKHCISSGTLPRIPSTNPRSES